MTRRRRRCRIDGHAQRRRGCTGVGGRIACRGRQAVRTVRQCRGRVAPGPAAIGHHAAQQGCAVKHLDRAVGFRRPAQGQRIVVGDAVAHRAAVGRERGDARRHRRHRVNRHSHDR